jgi:hypothetical protein
MAKKESSTEIVKADPSTGIVMGGIGDAMKRKGLTLQRQVTLSEGQLLIGTFLGAGGPVELESQDAARKARGEKDIVASWRIRPEGAEVILLVLGSAGLDKHLNALAPGQEVAIEHLGRIKTRKGFMVNDFAVAVGDAPSLS